jgi:TolB-like protein
LISRHNTTILFVIATASLLTGGLFGAAASAAPATVAVLPFEMGAGEDLGHVQTQIRELLSARLDGEDQVQVIDKIRVEGAVAGVNGFAGESLALIAGAKLRADYVLYGDIASSGGRRRVDARLADMTGKRAPLAFSETFETLDGVIPEINRFATRVKKTIARWQGVEPARAEAPRFWQSPPFEYRIDGLALGDVDNDGATETVMISDHAVHIHRWMDGRRLQVAEVGGPRSFHNIGVDVADINGNGVPEIFVTRLSSDREEIDSLVLEYDGSGYKTIVEGAPWYYRVVMVPGAPPVLLGQRQTPQTADLLARPVFSMVWKDGAYASTTPVIKGGKANALGTAYLPTAGLRHGKAAAFGPGGHIRILDEQDRVLRESDAAYGGGMHYIEMPDEDPISDRKAVQYFPLRLVLTDMDGDGKIEVLTAANQEIAKRIFQRFRSLKKGRMTALSWTGMGLSPVWKTPTLGGRISDFNLGDIDNDGDRELVISVVSKEGDMAFTEGRSVVVVYGSTRP